MRVLIAILSLSSALLNAPYVLAQVGRHTLPHDTLSLGGEEQEVKLQRMAMHDEVQRQLTALRDSISADIAAPPDPNERGLGKQQLRKFETQLNELIDDFKRTEYDASLLKKAYLRLAQIRDQYHGRERPVTVPDKD